MSEGAPRYRQRVDPTILFISVWISLSDSAPRDMIGKVVGGVVGKVARSWVAREQMMQRKEGFSVSWLYLVISLITLPLHSTLFFCLCHAYTKL